MILIRPAHVMDAAAIASIQIACWQQRLNAWAPDWFVAQFKQDQQQAKYAERIEGDRYTIFTAELQGQIVGFAAVTANTSDPLEFQQQITALYVDPQHEKKGIGTALLKRVVQYSREKESDVVVWTFRDNAASRKLYEKCGSVLLPYKQAMDMDLDIPHVCYGWLSQN